ncbi:UNVERIFIED_CONTAM: hypothetical protein HDU68_004817 [Siphonaria sp. JEL0065]|nr:hypothetical protein HDU68_004817 [Siphonaria sp. JEL0065]
MELFQLFSLAVTSRFTTSFTATLSQLEQDRINNYAKHVSDATTVPTRWSIAPTYVDLKGEAVSETLNFGGSVQKPTTSTVQLSKVIWLLVTPLMGQLKLKWLKSFRLLLEMANHLILTILLESISTSVLLNHAFAHSIPFGIDYIPLPGPSPYPNSPADVTNAPNGDTGRFVADWLMHHEIFEHVSDPHPNTAYTDPYVGENGDACEYTNNWYPRLRVRLVRKDAVGQFVGPFKVKKPVGVADGLRGYRGINYLPCRAYYIDRWHAGSTVSGSNVCNLYINVTNSLMGMFDSHGSLNVVENFHLIDTAVSKAANYHWAHVDEKNAFKTFGDSVGPAPLTVSATDDYVFVTIDDQWNKITQANGQWVPTDIGAISSQWHQIQDYL